MTTVMHDLMRQYEDAKPYANTRTKHWFLIQENPVYVWAITIAYLLFTWLGPKFMKNRQPFHFTKFLIVYNLGLVAMSVYMFVEIILSVHAAGYGFFCAKYDPNPSGDPVELRVANVMYWYFFSKVIELMDTVLMVLRKKNEQISFLHVFHHASMLNIWWWVMMFIPGGLSYFGSCLNCLVHVVMYSYYGLSAIPSLRGKLWWKHYITKFQLFQFCITLVHSVNSLRLDCDFPKWGEYLLTGYMLTMLVLFTNFYVHSYIMQSHRRKQLSGKKAETNGYITKGAVSNGSNTNGHVSTQNGYVSSKKSL